MATSSDVSFDGLRGYVARPTEPARGGVVVLPGHYGLDDRARHHGDLLAAAGLTALVFDQYSAIHDRTPSHDDAAKWGNELRDTTSMAEMSKAVSYLLGEGGCATVGTIGFCQGGRFSLLLAATDHRVAACSTFYPSIFSTLKPNQDMDCVAMAGEIRCPVQLVHAGLDHITKADTFERLRNNLQDRAEPTLVQVFPEGDHGFMTTEEHPGAGNDIARALSWPQAVAFLQVALA